MKKSFIIAFFGVLSSFAQSKPDCGKQFNDFEVYYRKEFNEKAILTEEGRERALRLIQNTSKECPSYDKNIYVFAEDMLLQIIRPMNVGEERQKWTKHLTELYDKSGQHFPETAKENTLKKLVISYNSSIFSFEQAFKSFDEFYNRDKQIFSAEALLIYTNLVLTRQNLSSNGNVPSEYIKKTDNLSTSIATKISELERQKSNSKDEKEIKNIDSDITSLKIASKNISSGLKTANLNCDVWNKFYKEEYQKNSSDIFWLENALSRLDTYKCAINNELFTEMAQKYYELKKTAKSAYYLANIAQQQKDYKKAQAYFTESTELETNKSEKAKLHYRIADLQKGTDKTQAKANLEKAIENNPEMFEAYIVLSQLYANASDCANNEFERKTLNLLAAENIKRITTVNTKYNTSAQKIIDGYLEKAPTKDEIKKEKMKGKTVSFGCWINQSVTIR